MAAPLYGMSAAGALTAQHALTKSSVSLPSSIASRFQICGSLGRPSSHVAHARRSGLSSRSRRLEKRGKKDGGPTTADQEREGDEDIVVGEAATASAASSVEIEGGMEYSKEPMPKQEGLEPDFWEGPQWNAFGFFIQYLWAFGILFGVKLVHPSSCLIACLQVMRAPLLIGELLRYHIF